MSQNHQVGATWQSIWMNLINQSVTAYFEKRYVDSFQALEILHPWLPEECASETQKSMEILQKGAKEAGRGEGYFANQITRTANKQLNLYLLKNIPKLSQEIKKSLETHHWIHREDNYAQPRSSGKPHIGE